MRAAWGGYSAWRGYKVQRLQSVPRHLSHALLWLLQLLMCQRPMNWDWYFSLTSCAIQQALASYPAQPFPFVYRHFRAPQVSRYGKRAARKLIVQIEWELSVHLCNVLEVEIPCKYNILRKGQLKCDDTRAENRFRLSAKRTSPFKSAGGCQFSRLLAAEVYASGVVMLDTPCSEVVWRVLATHSSRQFPLHFPSRASPCALTFQLESTKCYGWEGGPYPKKRRYLDCIFPIWHYVRMPEAEIA